MRLVIQRVREAVVAIGGEPVSHIAGGMMCLVGVENGDTREDADWLAQKLASMRIFDDEKGVMNIDVRQAGGEVMAVSQFTLHASTRKGNRPSYIRAARPEVAKPLYEHFCEKVEQLVGKPVARGVFGANMQVSLINDGPVTIIIDSRTRD